MTYLRRLLPVLLFTVLFAPMAVGAEAAIPTISIPPAAQYLAQRVSDKFTAYCKEIPECIPPFRFNVPTGVVVVLSFTRSDLGGALNVIEEEEGPLSGQQGADGATRHMNRDVVTISGDGKLLMLKRFISVGDVIDNVTETELPWSVTINLLDTVDQLLDFLTEHRERLLRSPDKEA